MITEKLLMWLDASMERHMRSSAQHNGRRSFLSKAGAFIVGGTLLPMLPFDRSGAAEQTRSMSTDETSCEYWAYCSMGGARCNACGGSINQCPPGSQPSVLSWVGTCINPKDKRSYLVSYSDCCGKTDCDVPEEAMCSHNQGERPGYRIGVYNDADWCMANTNVSAHCSTAVIIGMADAS